MFDRLNVNVTSRLDARVPQHTLSDGPAAHIRYASMYGMGLVELNKYKEAIGPLDEAIQVAAKTRNVAYPSIAVNARIEALSGIGQNDQALALAADAMRKATALHLAGHQCRPQTFPPAPGTVRSGNAGASRLMELCSGMQGPDSFAGLTAKGDSDHRAAFWH